jgi:dTMP kinase
MKRGIVPVAGAGATFAAVARGLFVSFEGIDRSGKTTQARMLVDALGDAAVAVREPGGTEAGERIRALLKDPELTIGAHAEALLFAAARAELADQVVRPALDHGRVVVSDRFVDSSLAYQGGARGLGVDAVARVNDWALQGLKPDLTIFLELPAHDAAARAGEEDRFEAEGAGLQERVQLAYEELAAAEPERWRRVDAARDSQQVHADVLRIVETARAEAATA